MPSTLALSSSVSCRPLPALPVELKKEVLRFCDRSTLAKASQVSLAFLEMASPLLYHDIVINGQRQLDKLFCERPVSLPQLASFLSLTQIKTLRFIVDPDDYGPVPRMTCDDRIAPASCLPLETLIINDGESDYEAPTPFECYSFFDLLPLFQPVQVEFRTWPLKDKRYKSRIESAATGNLNAARLKKITFVDVAPGGLLRDDGRMDWDEELIEYDGQLETVVLECTFEKTKLVQAWVAAVKQHLEGWTQQWKTEVQRVEVRMSSKEMVTLAQKAFRSTVAWNKMTFVKHAAAST